MKQFKTFNQKNFISPGDINSMSAVFCKAYDNGLLIVRISDCNNTIKIWNDRKDAGGLDTMITKVSNLIEDLENYRQFLNDEKEKEKEKESIGIYSGEKL